MAAASISAGGFTVDTSVRYNDYDSPRLYRTPSAAGIRIRGSLSLWYKRCNLGSIQQLFNAGAGDDIVIAGAGNDEISGDEGADVLDGGEGVDTLSYQTSSEGVDINLTTNETSGGDANGDIISNIETDGTWI